MKKFLTIAAALALVLGLSQCRKPNAPTINGGNGTTQHVTLTSSFGGDGSKLDVQTVLGSLNLKWVAGDVISIAGPNSGTLECISASYDETTKVSTGTFDGVITHNSGDITFTVGTEPKYLEQYGGEITENEIYLVGTSEYKSDGNYGTINMTLPYAILKLDLSALGTAGDGNEVRIYKEEETNPIATVLNVKDDSKDLYVALPTDNPSTTENPDEITYRFVGNSKVVNKPWGIKQNTFYTKSEDAGKAMVVAPESPTKTSPSATTLESCVNCQQVLKGEVTPNETQTCEYGLVYSKKSVNAAPVLYGAGCTMVKDNAASLSSATEYTFDLAPTDFEKGVEYVVKAYAIGENGIPVYGEAKIFEFPTPITWNGGGTQGASPYEFTVYDPTPSSPNSGDETKVRFSQGNLQYIGSAATPYWKFADHQFDFLGTTTGQDSETATVDRDLFGWGCTGFVDTRSTDHANWYQTNYQPYSTSTSTVNTTYNYYGYGPDYINNPYYSLTVANKSDWGYNAISNGGNTTNSGWRTLKQEEWCYLLSDANNSKWALGMVGSCAPGLIILPDDWTCPTGCTFEGGKTDFTTNVYSYTQWHDMESAGAVFLPAAGGRNGSSVGGVGSHGYYWSSSYYNRVGACNLGFYSGVVDPQYCTYRYGGCSVRLVR